MRELSLFDGELSAQTKAHTTAPAGASKHLFTHFDWNDDTTEARSRPSSFSIGHPGELNVLLAKFVNSLTSCRSAVCPLRAGRVK
jgi:hypothetical protein